MVVKAIDYNNRQEFYLKSKNIIWNPIYFFLDKYGEYKKYGYVASDKNRAFWRKTKKEAISCLS